VANLNYRSLILLPDWVIMLFSFDATAMEKVHPRLISEAIAFSIDVGQISECLCLIP
jgi:hypothetical protein